MCECTHVEMGTVLATSVLQLVTAGGPQNQLASIATAANFRNHTMDPLRPRTTVPSTALAHARVAPSTDGIQRAPERPAQPCVDNPLPGAPRTSVGSAGSAPRASTSRLLQVRTSAAPDASLAQSAVTPSHGSSSSSLGAGSNGTAELGESSPLMSGRYSGVAGSSPVLGGASALSVHRHNPLFDGAESVAGTVSEAGGTPARQVQLRAARHAIQALLQTMNSVATSPAAVVAQQAMEAQYVDWAALQVVDRQEDAGDANYAPGGHNAPNALAGASLGMVYSALSAGLKSSSRSPFRAAAAVNSDQEFTIKYDVSVISGAVSAIPAAVVGQALVPAMEGRAKIANLDRLKAVDLKILFPDPGPVVLRVSKGPNGALRKAFVKPIEDCETPGDIAAQGRLDAPTRKELMAEAQVKREQLKAWQDFFSGQGAGVFTKPALAGGAGALRRLVSPDALLLTAGGAWCSTGAASFFAAFLDDAMKSIAQAVPGVSGARVDNLAGGTQRMNAFKLERNQADRAPAQWSDIRQAPAFTADVFKETAALLHHALLPSWQANAAEGQRPAWNIDNTAKQLAGLVSANVFAAVAGNACGPFFAQIVRGSGVAAGPSEAPQSKGNVAEGFATSGINELVWGLLSSTSALGGVAPSQADTLKRHRGKTADALERRIGHNLAAIDNKQATMDGAMEAGLPADVQRLAAEIADTRRTNNQLQKQLADLQAWQTQPASERRAGESQPVAHNAPDHVAIELRNLR